MNSFRLKGTNFYPPNRWNHSVHTQGFNVDNINSGGTNLSFVPLFIPMLDLVWAGWKQAFLIWLDEYEMQKPGRAMEQG